MRSWLPLTRLLLAALVWISSTAIAQETIHVIVHPDNGVASLSKKQVIDLFMGRVAVFPDQQAVLALDLPAGDPLRARFYQALTGKTEAQVDAYWATLIFAGRMSPPQQLQTQQEIIAKVQRQRNAIAYIAADKVPATVKSVLQLP